ncbi:MAG: HNH endonuclease [Sandaracinaceae bacterium]|nr:HNH endonuclease [Sandaracinaceae bacterium]
MEGYVAVTDPDWWKRLSRDPGPKDANFWRPSARPRRLAIGTPFFFKLKAPYRKIAGFGYFAGFSVLPDWLAWDSFKLANGVASLKELRTRLQKIQLGARIEADPGGHIGCCLIAESIFFAESDWVDPPEGWSPRTQSGAGIDLSRGDGARIWRECLERVASAAAVVRERGERYGEPVLHRPRLGQAIFRIRVLDSYDRACAVTTEHSLPVLDAAHIKPFAEGGAHDVTNGLALRTDLHRLFDRGYVTVDEDDRFVVGKRLREEFENGKTYYALQGTKLVLPSAPDLLPSSAALAWHRSEVFVG